MIRIETIGDCLDHGYNITVHCGCVGARQPDLMKLTERYGRHVPLRALRGRLRCRKCHCIGDKMQLHSVAAARATGRPAHIHFIVGAEGCEPVTTHIFSPDCPYLHSDAVFGVKEREPYRRLRRVDDPAQAAALGLPNPFWTLDWDFVLIRRGRQADAAARRMRINTHLRLLQLP